MNWKLIERALYRYHIHLRSDHFPYERLFLARSKQCFVVSIRCTTIECLHKALSIHDAENQLKPLPYVSTGTGEMIFGLS